MHPLIIIMCHHTMDTHGWGWSRCTGVWLSSRPWPRASAPGRPGPRYNPGAPASSPRHHSRHHTPHPRTERHSHSHWRCTGGVLVTIKIRLVIRQRWWNQRPRTEGPFEILTNNRNQPATIESKRRRERHPVILLWALMLVVVVAALEAVQRIKGAVSQWQQEAAAGYQPLLPAWPDRRLLLLTSNAGLPLVSQPQSWPLIGWPALHGIMSWPSPLWANKIISECEARVYKINTDPDTNRGNKDAKGLGEIPNGLGLCLMLFTLLPLSTFLAFIFILEDDVCLSVALLISRWHVCC